jgi:hypothetical protein
MLVGPSGLGKTHFAMAMSAAAAGGRDFLHWRSPGRLIRVLYVDGEMSARLMKSRREDAERRLGVELDTLFVLNREDFDDLPPLNTENGQRYIDRIINITGGVDLAVFDNIHALCTGIMKEEESWQPVLPWIRSLTARKVGQLWVQHTGLDETHSYGTNTREWQLDTVMLMERTERVDQPDVDIAFKLTFTKARERSPHNRSDFEPAVITLAKDEWSSERGNLGRRGGKKTDKERAYELLIDALARGQGQIPPADEHIPPATPAISEFLWRRIFIEGSIAERTTDATEKAFRRAAKDLLNAERIGRWSGWIWPVRT